MHSFYQIARVSPTELLLFENSLDVPQASTMVPRWPGLAQSQHCSAGQKTGKTSIPFLILQLLWKSLVCPLGWTVL